MEKYKVSPIEISWFNSIFEMNNFLEKIDYIKNPWSATWEMKISEWFDATEQSAFEKNINIELFKINSDGVYLSLFPLNEGNDKYKIKNSRDLENVLKEVDYFSVVPFVIYSNQTILIFEPDIEMIIILCHPKSKYFAKGGYKYYSFDEYLSQIQELKRKGFIK